MPPRDAQGRFVSVRKPVPAAVPGSANPANPAAGGWFNGVGKTTSRPGKITVYSLSGAPLDLTPSNIRASGGEGTVYDVPGKPNVLVKIYKSEKLADQNKRKELTERISAMVKKTDLCNLPWLAWPCMGVFDANRQLIGFGMRKISGESFYTLETREKLRQRNWDRADLAAVTLDFVGKLELLAQHGVLVNDFNPSNFLFNDQHEVLLIDCDSFQVTDPQGKILPTRTFFPSHVAPELLADKSQLARPRDIHHLEFGVALTVFNILMNGLHPYSYFDPLHKSACGSPEENLRKGRCPLDPGARCKLPVGDWFKVWSHFTYNLKGAFITTFREGHADRDARTSLAQFQEVLQDYLIVMDKDPVRRELFPDKAKAKSSHDASRFDNAGNF